MDDPIIKRVQNFLYTWAEHDDDCPARDMGGPGVMDPANCTCGLTMDEQEVMAELRARLAQSK